ncbi:right-handed parallel beta-helix repeat-containing protein [candidate division WOR-3 bacterium]|nr:right-handed parallel beta-helix repeat-containing protein [candidate division WOR-3 bacterium]
MRPMHLLLAAALCAALAAPASARIIHVPDSVATIRAAISAAHSGDTVLADTGIYEERIELRGHGVTVASRFLLTGDRSFITNTVIQPGASPGTVVSFFEAGDSTDVLAGFTIRNGSGTNGGGIHCWGGSALIRDNIIEDNFTTADGGGVMIQFGAKPTVVGNVIRRNRTNIWGGGVYVHDGCSPVVERNVIYDNGAITDRPAGFTGPGTCCGRVLGPGATAGGYDCRGGGVLVTNYTGAPMAPIVVNNTIDGNEAQASGGGIYVNHAPADVRNNIVTASAPAGVHTDGPELTIAYNDAWGNGTNISGSTREGQGSISACPMYADSAGDDFHLQAGSPCIDAGDPASPPDPDSTRADMGAFWFFQTGAAEPGSPVVTPASRAATIVWGVLHLGVDSKQNTECGAELLDAGGRRVMTLAPGANDVSRLSPGIYFLKDEGGRLKDEPGSRKAVRKVIVAR